MRYQDAAQDRDAEIAKRLSELAGAERLLQIAGFAEDGVIGAATVEHPDDRNRVVEHCERDNRAFLVADRAQPWTDSTLRTSASVPIRVLLQTFTG